MDQWIEAREMREGTYAVVMHRAQQTTHHLVVYSVTFPARIGLSDADGRRLVEAAVGVLAERGGDIEHDIDLDWLVHLDENFLHELQERLVGSTTV
ncbi:hypothetical protein TL08_11115 [Actinoalloteichus hymeniacidonis]|uniref:Uncharacterized protein n=2 Tax=Actinoalloteichus hymeniacidonis TaxID=340345 RepID=A0AAC9HPE1_9PSEU|nr:hypothetical protein TL08_11115 [Actinoalloteichus hymeniacidonis]